MGCGRQSYGDRADSLHNCTQEMYDYIVVQPSLWTVNTGGTALYGDKGSW